MNTKFTASNGLEIEIKEDGYLVGKENFESSLIDASASSEGVEALREFFQHERDQELGRWRDPVNRDLVVYRLPKEDNTDGRAVRVIDETSGDTFIYWENFESFRAGKHAQMWKVAVRYFEAHPELRPWDEAEPGEAWVLTIDGSEEAAMLMYSYDSDTHEFYIGSSDSLYSRSDPSITAGRRIWPEEGHTK